MLAELCAPIELAFVTSPAGSVVTPEAVALLSMRRAGGGTLTDPWRGFDPRAELASREREFIRAALAASGGEITRTARLLGFNSHQALNFKIKKNHLELTAERKPVRLRYKSIIKEGAGRHGGRRPA